MPLINCSVCERQISTEAESCPHCGHPNRATTRAPTGPTCYSCSAPATTKCQSCGTLSCAQHLQSIYVSHGQGGAYELRCESCHSSAMTWTILGPIITVIIFVIFYFAVCAPHEQEMDKMHNEFDKKWNGERFPDER